MQDERVKEERTEEQDYYEKELKTDTLYVRLTNRVYKNIYKIAKRNNTTMSEVARLAIESNLMDVDNLLKEIKRLKSEYKSK